MGVLKEDPLPPLVSISGGQRLGRQRDENGLGLAVDELHPTQHEERREAEHLDGQKERGGAHCHPLS